MVKPLRLALRTHIIQAEYEYSDEETALQMQKDPYLQYFCGSPGCNDEKLSFAPSLVVLFRKRLDILRSPADRKKPLNCRKRSRKDYLKYVRQREHPTKMTRKAIRKQLNHLQRERNATDEKRSSGKIRSAQSEAARATALA